MNCHSWLAMIGKLSITAAKKATFIWTKNASNICV